MVYNRPWPAVGELSVHGGPDVGGRPGHGHPLAGGGLPAAVRRGQGTAAAEGTRQAGDKRELLTRC